MAIAGIGVTYDFGFRKYHLTTQGSWTLHLVSMRLAAAVKWYEIGLISQSKAAELAGVSRAEFISSLSRFCVSPFQETPEELEEEFKGD